MHYFTPTKDLFENNEVFNPDYEFSGFGSSLHNSDLELSDLFKFNNFANRFPSFELINENKKNKSDHISIDRTNIVFDKEFYDKFNDNDDELELVSKKATGGSFNIPQIFEDKIVPLNKLTQNSICNTNFHNQSTAIEASEDKGSQKDNEEDKTFEERAKLKLLEPIKYTRWGKKDDRRLYTKLKVLQKEGLLSLSDFSDDSTLPEDSLITSLSYEVSWRGSQELLIRRIRKILKPSKLSVRERKLLLNLVIEAQQQKTIDYEEISYNFPGKDLQYLKNEIQIIIEEEAMNKSE